MYKSVLSGLGNVAWKMGRDSVSGSSLSHLDAFNQHNKVSLIAGYSPNASEVQFFSNFFNVIGYDDFSQMLYREKPDIVSICSPHVFHAKQLEICLDHKVPMIWVEKPVANSVNEIVKLEKLSKQMCQSSTVLVNFQRRYTESYQKLRKLLEKGIYGHPLSVEIHYSRGLLINGSHMIDMLVYLFPESQLELLWVERNYQSDSPDFIVQIQNNLIAHISGIEATYHNIDIIVTCEQARFSIEHGGMSINVEKVKENSMFAGHYRLYYKETDELGMPGFNHAFDKALENLILSHEKKCQPDSNLNTALKGQILVEEVLRQSAL